MKLRKRTVNSKVIRNIKSLCDELGIDYQNASLWLKAASIPPEIIQMELSKPKKPLEKKNIKIERKI